MAPSSASSIASRAMPPAMGPSSASSIASRTNWKAQLAAAISKERLTLASRSGASGATRRSEGALVESRISDDVSAFGFTQHTLEALADGAFHSDDKAVVGVFDASNTLG
jgi:hypothetical protein